MAINEENTQDKTAENAFAKCRLAAGLFINDVEVPWMNFEKVSFWTHYEFLSFFLMNKTLNANILKKNLFNQGNFLL